RSCIITAAVRLPAGTGALLGRRCGQTRRGNRGHADRRDQQAAPPFAFREYHAHPVYHRTDAMFVSAFDLFKIGLGPSSSHTVGPMRAALRFVHELAAEGKLEVTERIGIDLYGSLGLTGRGHGTDRAVLLGLSGEAPDRIDPDTVESKLQRIYEQNQLTLDAQHTIPFRVDENLRFRIDKTLAFHSNGMRFTAFDGDAGIVSR